jgi:hypothetical protein
LTVKVKAKPKIVGIQVHFDFNYATNLKAKNIRRKGCGEIGNWGIRKLGNLAIDLPDDTH